VLRPEGDAEICGPFGLESKLNAALVKRPRAIWAANKKHSFKADFYERNLDAVLKGHEAVFSHSDLQRKNILVRRVQPQARLASKCFEVAIIDSLIGRKQAGIQATVSIPPFLLHSSGVMTGRSD